MFLKNTTNRRFNWRSRFMVAAWLDGCLLLPHRLFYSPTEWIHSPMCLDGAQAQPLTQCHCQARQKCFDNQMIVNMLWKNIQLICRETFNSIDSLSFLLPFCLWLQTKTKFISERRQGLLLFTFRCLFWLAAITTSSWWVMSEKERMRLASRQGMRERL